MTDKATTGTIELETWDDFVGRINLLQTKFGPYIRMLYRGQANHEWGLITTLERDLPGFNWGIESYAKLSRRCVPEIESFTEKNWDVPEFPEIVRDLSQNSKQGQFYLPQKLYKLWAHLRHHGFPSPLLDWSASPYVAAFFALCYERPAEIVSVFAYIETPERFKLGSSDAPLITVLGPFVSTHKRHFLQQCYYTVCASEFRDEPGYRRFVSHEEVFKAQERKQDLIYKFTIPASARIKALEQLSLFNINHFSLFQTEDSLVKTLALKEIERQHRGLEEFKADFDED